MFAFSNKKIKIFKRNSFLPINSISIQTLQLSFPLLFVDLLKFTFSYLQFVSVSHNFTLFLFLTQPHQCKTTQFWIIDEINVFRSSTHPRIEKKGDEEWNELFIQRRNKVKRSVKKAYVRFCATPFLSQFTLAPCFTRQLKSILFLWDYALSDRFPSSSSFLLLLRGKYYAFDVHFKENSRITRFCLIWKWKTERVTVLQLFILFFYFFYSFSIHCAPLFQYILMWSDCKRSRKRGDKIKNATTNLRFT